MSSDRAPGRDCPSAQPDMAGARIIGIVRHDRVAPTVDYLPSSEPVTPALLALSHPLPPTELFRFAASCQEDACSHWKERECSLAERIVDLIPANTLALPRCDLRRSCQWFAQEGTAACTRCEKIVTQNEHPDAAMRDAAAPPNKP